MMKGVRLLRSEFRNSFNAFLRFVFDVTCVVISPAVKRKRVEPLNALRSSSLQTSQAHGPSDIPVSLVTKTAWGGIDQTNILIWLLARPKDASAPRRPALVHQQNPSDCHCGGARVSNRGSSLCRRIWLRTHQWTRRLYWS